MDFHFVLSLLSELTYILIVGGVFCTYAVFSGRQAIINVIISLYLALLLYLQFPYQTLVQNYFTAPLWQSIAQLGLFFVFFVFCFVMTKRVMPSEFREKRFESFTKKIILGCAATVLVMIFSFHVLPITELLHPGTPIQSLFAPDILYFWWLLLPLIVLMFVL